jgi:hypothetical protein
MAKHSGSCSARNQDGINLVAGSVGAGPAAEGKARDGLGDAFTPEVREAWIAMYEIVAVEMQRGAARMAA